MQQPSADLDALDAALLLARARRLVVFCRLRHAAHVACLIEKRSMLNERQPSPRSIRETPRVYEKLAYSDTFRY
jgi:hypothetical protein